MENQKDMKEFERLTEGNFVKQKAIEPEIKVSRSRDGKWVIVKTIQTQIYSINYFKKVLGV